MCVVCVYSCPSWAWVMLESGMRRLLSVRAGTLNRYLSPTLKERFRARRAPIGYGRFPKNRNALPQLLVFGRQDFQKRYFRKTRNCGSAFQFWGKCPYPIGAPHALRRSLSVGLRYRFSVPARTDCHCTLRAAYKRTLLSFVRNVRGVIPCAK